MPFRPFLARHNDHGRHTDLGQPQAQGVGLGLGDFGPPAQLSDRHLVLPLSFTSETTVNGATTSYLAVGVNLVGVALVILLRQQRQTFSARE